MIGSYESKKGQIKKASINVFARYGYHKTTLEDIANQLGIKKNSLYYYFQNKETIFNEIIVEEAAAFVETLDAEIKKQKTTEKKLKVVISKIIYYAKERSNLLTMPLKVFIEIGELIENSHKEFRESVRGIIEKVLKDGIKSGELKKHNSRELSQNIYLFIDALQFKELHSNQITSFEELDLPLIEKRVLSTVNFILTGLKV